MPGMLDWKIKISADIKDLQNKMHKVEGELGEFEGKDHKVKLDLDTKTLESALKKLDSMLDSLGKGTGDFKQFETLSKDLAKVTSELSGFTKAFGKIDNSGTKSLLDMVQNIDKSLNNLSNHVTDEFLNKITSSVGTVKQKFADIGDGSEFEPLLQMINNIDSSINNLAKETSKIKLNMNLDFGTEMSEKMNQQVSKAVSRQAQAYKNLFETMKGSGKTTEEMIKFSLPENASNSEIVGAYKGVIERAEKQYGKSTYSLRLGSKYNDAKNEVKNANAALRRAEIKRTNSNGVSDLLGGNFGDVINELSKIAAKLDEISSSASGLKSAFETGFNVSASVEEIAQLTNKVKKLEDELQKVKSVSSGTVSTGVTLGNESNISSGLDSNISKYQEIVSLVKEYYELTSKIKQPTLKHQSRPEDYDKIDGYLLKKAPPKVGTTDIEKDINDRYHKMAKGVNEGNDFAIKAMKSAIQKYWSDVTEMPSDDKLLSSRKVIPYGNKSQKEEYIIPKKYQDMEKSVIQETIAMNKNNIAYEEERKQIEANNSALKERMDLIRNTIKSYDKNPDYNGEYRMGLSLKSSDKGKTDIFSSASSMSQEEMLQEICNMLGVEIPKNADKAKEAIKEVASATATTEPKKDAFPDKDVSASVESATNSIKEENNVLEQNTQKVKENTQAKEQNANANLNKYDKRLDSYNGKVDKYQATIDRFNDGGWTSDTYLKNVQAVRDAIKQYATLLDNIKTNQNGIASDEDIQNLDKYEKKIKDTIATVTNMSAAEKGYNFVSGQKELDKIHKILDENSRMSSEAKAKIKAYYKEIESGNPSMSLDRIHGEIMKIYNAEVEAGRAGKSLIDVFKTSRLHQMVAQVAGMFSVYDVINGLKQVASTIRELDTAYTEMRKVSDESAQSLKNFQKESFSTADSVGTTALAMQDATATWMRLGESLDEAKESAKDATVLLNVSEFDNIDEATDSLVAMSQAYKDLDKMEIIDVLDKIGNEYSISTDQLSTALKDSAAVLKTQGNDLAESVALITAGNAITQDASKTAGETLPERYRNIFYRTYLTARAA